MSTQTQSDEPIYEFTNIDLRDLAHWIFNRPSGGMFQWNKHVSEVITPMGNTMLTYKLPDGYLSVLSRRIVINKQSKEYLASHGMYKPKDIIKTITGLDMYISDREDMKDSKFISRFTIISNGEKSKGFLSVPDDIVNTEGYDAEDHAKTAKIVTVPVLVAFALLDGGTVPLEKKKLTRAQKRRAAKNKTPIIKQYKFYTDKFIPHVEKVAEATGKNEAEVAIALGGWNDAPEWSEWKYEGELDEQ